MQTQLALYNLRMDNVATASAIATSQNFFLLGNQDPKALMDGLRAKENAFAAGEPLPPPERRATPAPEEAEAAVRLIATWEELSDLLLISSRFRAVAPAANEPGSEERARFLSLFRDEIQFVRVARNSVAHGMAISQEQMDKAVSTAEELMRIWRGDKRA